MCTSFPVAISAVRKSFDIDITGRPLSLIDSVHCYYSVSKVDFIISDRLTRLEGRTIYSIDRLDFVLIR